jgi:hypothetical protein
MMGFLKTDVFQPRIYPEHYTHDDNYSNGADSSFCYNNTVFGFAPNRKNNNHKKTKSNKNQQSSLLLSFMYVL